MSGIEEFSGFEVIKAAMEVERNGHRFYSTLATQARSPLARDLFALMAQDEISHLRALEGILARYRQGSFWEDEAAIIPFLRQFNDREIFPSAARLEPVLASPKLDLLALDLAIEAEERFAGFFQAAAERALDPDGKEAFAWLAREEASHAQLLRERKSKLTQAG